MNPAPCRAMRLAKPGARLAIVGMGALGTEVCHKLANNPALRSLFRSVLLVDPDRVESGNVAISHLFHAAFTEQQEKLFGQFKVDVVANLLQADPVCTWKAEASEIADVSWHKLRDVDLLVCCTDNALARVETCFVALSLGLPMLDGGVLGEAAAGGRVTWFSPFARGSLLSVRPGPAEQGRVTGLRHGWIPQLPIAYRKCRHGRCSPCQCLPAAHRHGSCRGSAPVPCNYPERLIG